MMRQVCGLLYFHIQCNKPLCSYVLQLEPMPILNLFPRLQVYQRICHVTEWNGKSSSRCWLLNTSSMWYPVTTLMPWCTKVPSLQKRNFTSIMQTGIIQSSPACLHLFKEATTATAATKGTTTKVGMCVRMDASAAVPTHSAHLRNGCFASHVEGGLCQTPAYKTICEVPSTFVSLSRPVKTVARCITLMKNMLVARPFAGCAKAGSPMITSVS